MEPRMRVAVLGTGRMGQAAARRLAALGFELVLWNRTLEKAEKLAEELGARTARSPGEAVQNVEAATLFLADDDALYSVLADIRRMDGLVVINMGTHTPRASRYARNYVESNGGCYVESPIVAGPRPLSEGRAVLIVACRRHCYAPARPVLEALGGEAIIYLGEDAPQAQALKLAFNSLLITTVTSLAESLKLAEAYGVSREVFKELLSHTVFRSVSEKYVDRMTRPPEEPASFTARLAAKDLEYAENAGYDAGVPLPLVMAALLSYMKIPSEKRDADYTRIYHFL
ncbi:MAG: NAD(P)-dependent oxidoreductase [Desulfurococcales archaeon]|nr:NAD(P)-dependent oxidoreductase [Desulfurococcales archaeon]